MELRLKELLKGLNYCIQQDDNFPTHHRLDTLWFEFKKKYSEIQEDINTIEFQSMDELIKEFSQFDPMSMSFRYPVDKEGNRTQKLEKINVVNLRESFVRICFLFDGVSIQIAHYVDITKDMMGDLYSNFDNY
jgi:hypothetical protein